MERPSRDARRARRAPERCLWAAELSRMAWITLPAGTDHFDGCDEADELLMPMARRAAADDLAFEHAERGEQGRRAVAFVIVREGCCAFPPLQGGRPCWVRSSTWIWLFSSMETTAAWRGGFM